MPLKPGEIMFDKGVILVAPDCSIISEHALFPLGEMVIEHIFYTLLTLKKSKFGDAEIFATEKKVGWPLLILLLDALSLEALSSLVQLI